MAYLGCEVCGTCILGLPDDEISKEYPCCKRCEHAYNYAKRNYENRRDTDLRLAEVFDQLERILDHATPDMHAGKDVVSIPAHVISKALEIKHRKCGKPEFWSGNYYMLSMACEVVHLFKPTSKSYTRNRLQQFQHLRELAKMWTESEFPTDPPITLSVVDLLQELKKIQKDLESMVP